MIDKLLIWLLLYMPVAGVRSGVSYSRKQQCPHAIGNKTKFHFEHWVRFNPQIMTFIAGGVINITNGLSALHAAFLKSLEVNQPKWEKIPSCDCSANDLDVGLCIFSSFSISFFCFIPWKQLNVVSKSRVFCSFFFIFSIFCYAVKDEDGKRKLIVLLVHNGKNYVLMTF